MQKVKSNALWRGLSAQQRETLDHWLFDEGHSYAVILPRAQQELGFKGQMSSLKRYYARREKERTFTKFEKLGVQVAALAGAPVDAKALRHANMQVIHAYLFQVLRENPEAIKELAPVVRALLQNDFNESFREIKERDLRLREETMAFAKERFEFDMTEKALKALPQLQELAEARKDPLTKRYEEHARRNRLRRAIFGPEREVEPENAQEEAEMLAAKQEREERRRQQLPAQPEGECLIGPPPPSSPHYAGYVEAKAKREAEDRAQEKAYAESQAQAAAREVEQAAEASAANQAEREKRRKYREMRMKFEEAKELCGWHEFKRPPGWRDVEGWKDAPLEWDEDDAYLEWGEG